MSSKNTDLDHAGSDLPPQAGTHGQPGSHISGQTGPEILGGMFSDLIDIIWLNLRNDSLYSLFKGSASTRILGQSVDEQLKTELPSKNENQ